MNETIIALSTPSGQSAIAIIRLSGNLCKMLMQDCFGICSPTPRYSYLSTFKNLNNETIDQVIVCFYEHNKSYTGEQMIEISCHGNQLIIHKIISDIVSRGVRNAEPGEFTKRAFLSGKIDLIQAESVAEMIAAKNEKALRLANKNLSGNLSQIIENIQQKIIDIHSRIEAYIDFPEDDIGSENRLPLIDSLEECHSIVQNLVESYKRTQQIHKNHKVLLLGATNAGKSSLFNTLVGFDRSIVSEIPGTTRDYVSKELVINGLNIELIDAAGIRHSDEKTENIGVERTKRLIVEADMILLIVDVGVPYPTDLDTCINSTLDSKMLIVENKIDVKRKIDQALYPKDIDIIQISALKKTGIEALIHKMSEEIDSSIEKQNELNISVNARHKEFLDRVFNHIDVSIQLLKEDSDEILIAHELKESTSCLGNIVNRKDNEDMLDKLFDSFCIGK